MIDDDVIGPCLKFIRDGVPLGSFLYTYGGWGGLYMLMDGGEGRGGAHRRNVDVELCAWTVRQVGGGGQCKEGISRAWVYEVKSEKKKKQQHRQPSMHPCTSYSLRATCRVFLSLLAAMPLFLFSDSLSLYTFDDFGAEPLPCQPRRRSDAPFVHFSNDVWFDPVSCSFRCCRLNSRFLLPAWAPYTFVSHRNCHR